MKCVHGVLVGLICHDCDTAVIMDLKDEIDKLKSEREAYRSLAGIGFNGTDQADELAKITPSWERDAKAYKILQQRNLNLIKAAVIRDPSWERDAAELRKEIKL